MHICINVSYNEKRSKQKVKSVKIDKNKNVKTFYIYAITIRTAF